MIYTIIELAIKVVVNISHEELQYDTIICF